MSEPKEYVVSWDINLTAHNHREAAERALATILNPSSWATLWEVQEDGASSEDTQLIDLHDATRPYFPTDTDIKFHNAVTDLMEHLWDCDGAVYENVREALREVRAAQSLTSQD